MAIRLMLGVALVVGLPAALGAQTTFSNSTAIVLADVGPASPYPSAITVSGLTGIVRNVRVTLKGIAHTWPDDIDIALVGPSGECTMLLSDVGGDVPVTAVDVTLDDTAAGTLPDDTQLLSGIYKPTNVGGLDGFVGPGPGTELCAPTLKHLKGQNPNGTWKLFVVDDEPEDVGALSGGWSLTVTTQPWLDTDLDGDDRSDMTVWRGLTGGWWTRMSSGGTAAAAWGLQALGDIPLPADFDGDGKMDRAVFRNSTGAWYIQRSDSGYTTSIVLLWGAPGDVPVASDFDGDARADIAVFRPSNGTWYVRTSSTGYAGQFSVNFGTNGDVPVPGDYDGDGTEDIAVWRPTSGTWYIRRSTDLATATVTWGMAGDVPVPGNYDGDSFTDVAIWRPSSGAWWIRRSASGTVFSFVWGAGTLNDVPVAGDFDGDRRTDLAVFRRTTGVWFVKPSSGAAGDATAWGLPTDTPVRER